MGERISLAFTTYRANRLLFLGTSQAGDQLKLHERLFDRPMGLYADGASLWMAGRSQLWRLDNHLGPGQLHEGGDRLYVPAACFVTGDVNAHELVRDGQDRLIFVNTAFSCLATITPMSSFDPIWQPPFIRELAGDDRCHLNGLALQDGIPTWASACGSGGEPASWRTDRSAGGVVIHIPSGELSATGLAMPHSPRWHEGRLWLLNSGTGELGWIDEGHFQPVCALPGFVRGLAFVAGCAVVGLSKLRSPQFTGLPLEERLAAEGLPGGCCGLRVIDLTSGAVVHSFELPEPIDELFDVVVLPGVRQPRALGLQGEEIDCLVKLPDKPALVHVRPMAPSGTSHRGQNLEPFGLPNPAIKETAIHYQQVYQLTPANLAPYAGLTYPPLAPGSLAAARIQGELLGLSAMAAGVMVALAIAERLPGGGARLISLMVEPSWRQRRIGTGTLARLMAFLAKQGIAPLQVHYQSNAVTTTAFEPMLQRLGWSQPHTDLLLLQAHSQQLAAIDWAERHPIQAPYRLLRWPELSPEHWQQAALHEVPPELLPRPEAPDLDTTASLALLHDEVLVGWLMVERTSVDSVRYSKLYVASAHRGRARGLTLLATGFQRQHAAGIPKARTAIGSRDDAMLRLLRRHLSPYLSRVGSVRISEVALTLPGKGSSHTDG